MRNETIHLLGHAPLLVLALIALLAITQACTGGSSTGDSGFDGNSGNGNGNGDGNGKYGYGDYGDFGYTDYGDYGG